MMNYFPGFKSNLNGMCLHYFITIKFTFLKAGTSKNGGTIRVVPSTNFSSPSQRFSHGLAALNSQQRVSFKGPMPRPYTVRKM